MLVRTRFIDKGRSPSSSKAPHKSSCRRRLRTTPQVLSFLHFGVKRDRVGLYMGIVRDNRKSVKMNKKEKFSVLVGRERRKERKVYERPLKTFTAIKAFKGWL